MWSRLGSTNELCSKSLTQYESRFPQDIEPGLERRISFRPQVLPTRFCPGGDPPTVANKCHGVDPGFDLETVRAGLASGEEVMRFTLGQQSASMVLISYQGICPEDGYSLVGSVCSSSSNSLLSLNSRSSSSHTISSSRSSE